MKRRVGKYKDKIIVEGDKNEFKSHEVSIKELAGTDNMGGGGSGNNDITYYKVNLDNVPDENLYNIRLIACMVAAEMKAIFGESGHGFSNFMIAPAGYFIQPFDNLKPLAIGVQSYIKIITGMLDDNDNIIDKDSMIIEGNLKEVIDAVSEAFRLQINVFDYLEPITKEEFYNIKPE